MNLSFYSASTGAGAYATGLDVIGNNIANLNTTGFKAKRGSFTDLLYSNINAAEDENTKIVQGSGSRLDKTDTDFRNGTMIETRNPLDFSIVGSGFFKLSDPATEEISYTRDGSFHLSQQANGTFYLCASNGKWVLDSASRPIILNSSQDEVHPGVFDFLRKDGHVSIGDNEFTATAASGEPLILVDTSLLQQGTLESSNVDMGEQFTKIVETQRAYQGILKMIQTSDEIENVINTLR